MNELLLILSVLVIYGSVLVMYYLFDESGLYSFTVLATITANIEVLIMIRAFGMEQTLGNVLFAANFLVTDILSEVAGKKKAQKAVNIGIVISVIFILLTQMWLLYRPSTEDWVMPAIKTVFSNTPRMMIVGIVTYAIVQRFDVWAYHKWWALTKDKTGDERRFLWLRNNGSTLISQLLNTIIFTLGAFYGTYTAPVLLSIGISSYIIFIVTSLVDTPFIYGARKIHDYKVRVQSQKV